MAPFPLKKCTGSAPGIKKHDGGCASVVNNFVLLALRANPICRRRPQSHLPVRRRDEVVDGGQLLPITFTSQETFATSRSPSSNFLPVTFVTGDPKPSTFISVIESPSTTFASVGVGRSPETICMIDVANLWCMQLPTICARIYFFFNAPF